MTIDDGQTFSATIRKKPGQEELSRETDDRIAFLAWVAAHYQPGDELVVTIQSTGDAAMRTVKALQFGAAQMQQRQQQEAERKPS